MTIKRPLHVFLCHSSNDKPTAPKPDELYQKLYMTKSTFAAVEAMRGMRTVSIEQLKGFLIKNSLNGNIQQSRLTAI
jgi:hypothetical protein